MISNKENNNNSNKEGKNASPKQSTKEKTEPTEKEEYILGNYKLGKTIGEGTFGKVKIGTHKITEEKVNQI